MNIVQSTLEQWVRLLASASWQAALLIIVVVVATLLLRRSRPVVRYALWSVVLVRLCLPFGFISPLGIAGLSRQTSRWTSSAPAASPVSAVSPRFDRSPAAGLVERTDTVVGRGEARYTTSAPRGTTRLTACDWCGIVWLLGTAVLGAIVLQRWSRLRRIVEAGEPCQRPELIALLEELRGRFGIARPVDLRRLPAGTDGLGPCASGWRRPRILLPARLAESWELSTIEPILIHELAHIRRGDVAVNAIQVLVQVIYWFHPLVWLANARLRRERELICDDFAVLHSGANARRYGATILRALDEVRLEPGWSLAGVGMGESGLAQRLRRLLDGGYALPRPVSRGAIGALIFAGLIGVLMASDATPKKSVAGPSSAASKPDAAADQQAPGTPVLDQLSAPPATLPDDPDDPHAMAVTTAPKGEFSGRVVDHDGSPLAGVLVDAWDWCPGNETHTAADGTFRLTKLDVDRRIEVRFIKEGFAPYTIIKQPLGALQAPVVLDDRTYFEGVVTAPDGKPVPNAFIRANQGPKDADGVYITTIWTETHSDAQGRYQLRVQEDTYDLQVTTPSGLVARLGKVAIGAKQAVPLDVRLETGVVFRARIVDSQTGSPVAGVRLKDWDHPGFEGTSDAEGKLAIAGLIPGPFEFQVAAKGYARWWSEECTQESARRHIEKSGWQRNFDALPYVLAVDMEPVTITVEKGVLIRGRILDPNTHPVAGATAAAARTGSGNSLTGDTRFSVKTAADGSFEMLLPAGNGREYNLVAHDGAYKEWRNWANGVSEPFDTKPGEVIEGFELRLSSPATVRGRVVDADKHPVADREVRAQATDRRENRYYDPTVRTDADGRFEIKFIRPGKHIIQTAPFTDPDVRADGSNWTADLVAGQVLLSPDLSPLTPDTLITKEWKIPAGLIPADPKPLPPGIALAVPIPVGGDSSSAKEWLIGKGIVFNGEASAVFRDQNSLLVVRNTQAQIDLIDVLLELLAGSNQSPAAAGDKQADPAGVYQVVDLVIAKLEFRDATPADAFKTITAATGAKIFYTPRAEADEARITLSLTNVPASEALKYVTELANLKFSYDKDGVHVTAR